MEAPKLPPECSGRFEVRSLLGQGGFGAVYLAHQKQFDRPVALKILLPEGIGDAQQRARFLREARITASLSHPNIVRIYDLGTGDAPWIAYEYIPGQDLRSLVDRGPLAVDEAVQAVSQVAAALDAAHSAGVLHRDIKPENILRAGPGLYKLTDFGIAKRRTSASAQTAAGTIMGTPVYLSPEQVLGQPPTERSDQYALGIVLYELLCGHPPFWNDNVLVLLEHHVKSRPQPLRDRRPEVPGELEAVVRRTLEKDPADRFASVRELLAALSERNRAAAGRGRVDTLAVPVSSQRRKPAPAVTEQVSPPRPAIRPGMPRALAAALVVLVIGALTGFLVIGRRTPAVEDTLAAALERSDDEFSRRLEEWTRAGGLRTATTSGLDRISSLARSAIIRLAERTDGFAKTLATGIQEGLRTAFPLESKDPEMDFWNLLNEHRVRALAVRPERTSFRTTLDDLERIAARLARFAGHRPQDPDAECALSYSLLLLAHAAEWLDADGTRNRIRITAEEWTASASRVGPPGSAARQCPARVLPFLLTRLGSSTPAPADVASMVPSTAPGSWAFRLQSHVLQGVFLACNTTEPERVHDAAQSYADLFREKNHHLSNLDLFPVVLCHGLRFEIFKAAQLSNRINAKGREEERGARTDQRKEIGFQIARCLTTGALILQRFRSGPAQLLTEYARALLAAAQNIPSLWRKLRSDDLVVRLQELDAKVATWCNGSPSHWLAHYIRARIALEIAAIQINSIGRRRFEDVLEASSREALGLMDQELPLETHIELWDGRTRKRTQLLLFGFAPVDLVIRARAFLWVRCLFVEGLRQDERRKRCLDECRRILEVCSATPAQVKEFSDLKPSLLDMLRSGPSLQPR